MADEMYKEACEEIHRLEAVNKALLEAAKMCVQTGSVIETFTGIRKAIALAEKEAGG